MYDKLDFIQAKYDELSLKVSDPEVISNQVEFQKYIREKFTNSQDLRNFVSKNKNLSFFYAKEMILYRSK